MRCGYCHELLPEGALDCATCGHSPVPSPAASPREPAETGPGEMAQLSLFPPSAGVTPGDIPSDFNDDEHRQLTVMFCDIKDSTELSERLDTDALSDLVCAYHDVCHKVVARHGGHVAQYLGDGLLVYFGFPQARKDAAERAVRAGLEFFDELEELNAVLASQHGVQIEARVGINTGAVLMVELGGSDTRRGQVLGIGEPVNIAARLQALAEPGTVIMTDSTLALLDEAIECEPLGAHQLKGVAEPVQIYRALRHSEKWIVADTGARRLAGRDQQIAALLASFETVRTSGSRVILIEGEPGIGKSVLLSELRTRLVATPHTWLCCNCSDYPGEGGLQPLLTLLGDGLGFQPTMDAAERTQRLDRELTERGFVADRALPVVAPLFGLASGPGGGASSDPSSAYGERMSLVLEWLRRVAWETPVVLVVENLHWAETALRKLLEAHIAEAGDAPILTLVTTRPGECWTWSDAPCVQTLMLGALDREELSEVVRGAALPAVLPDALERSIVDRSAGNPLFAEELTRAMLASPGRPHTEATQLLDRIPARLRDLLMSRLDQLGAGKQLAQVGSVLGPRFSRDLLASVSGWDRPALTLGLQELAGAGVLQPVAGPEPHMFQFRHSLIQEMAYESLATRRRRGLHRRAAAAYDSRSPELRQLQPQLLAVHYEGAGQTVEALELWEQAAHRCIERSSHIEAVAHLEHALTLLRAIRPQQARIEREIELELSLGVALQVVKGYGAPEVARTFERTRQLCETLGDERKMFPVLSGLAAKCLLRAELSSARSLASELRGIAQRSGDALLLLWSSMSLGSAYFYSGDITRSLRALEAGLQCSGGLTVGAQRARYAGDPVIDCRLQMSLALWMSGRPAAAFEGIAEARRQARQAGLSVSLGYAGVVEGILRFFEGDTTRAARCSREVIELAAANPLPLWSGFARVVHGWATLRASRPDARLAEIDTGIAEVRATGARLGETFLLVVWADALRRAGRNQRAVEIIDKALARGRESGEHYLDAELLRVRGALLLDRDPHETCEAEACFRRARAIARRQRTQAWSLRAASSLATLWMTRGETERVGRILSSAPGAARPQCEKATNLG